MVCLVLDAVLVGTQWSKSGCTFALINSTVLTDIDTLFHLMLCLIVKANRHLKTHAYDLTVISGHRKQ